jgi:hypothetical protein
MMPMRYNDWGDIEKTHGARLEFSEKKKSWKLELREGENWSDLSPTQTQTHWHWLRPLSLEWGFELKEWEHSGFDMGGPHSAHLSPSSFRPMPIYDPVLSCLLLCSNQVCTCTFGPRLKPKAVRLIRYLLFRAPSCNIIIKHDPIIILCSNNYSTVIFHILNIACISFCFYDNDSINISHMNVQTERPIS